MMDTQQDPEAIERRRAQNRIAQRKHRQRRAQLLREYQQNNRRDKDRNTEEHDQDRQRDRGGDDHEFYSSIKNPEAPLYGQSSKRCINCQPERAERKTKSSHNSSLEDQPIRSSNQPSGTFNQASKFDDFVKTSVIQDENRTPVSPSALRVNQVVLPPPIDYISPNLTSNDNQYYLDVTASTGDDEYFLDGMLGSGDQNEATSHQNHTPSARNQTLDAAATSVDNATSSTTRPRSASHCSSGSKEFYSSSLRGTSSRRATFTALASPPVSEDGPPNRPSPVVRKHHKGKTALHLCAERGNEKIVRLLVDRGATIDAQDGFGSTALHYAARNSNFKVVRTLLQGGADTEILDHEGYSVLHVAAEVGSEEIISLLTQEGADLNSRVGMEEYLGGGSIT